MESIQKLTNITRKTVCLLTILTVALGLASQSAQADDDDYINTGDLVGWVFQTGEFWAYCYDLEDWIGLPDGSSNWIFMLDFESTTSPEQAYYACCELVGYMTRIHIGEVEKWVYIPGIDIVDEPGWVYVIDCSDL